VSCIPIALATGVPAAALLDLEIVRSLGAEHDILGQMREREVEGAKRMGAEARYDQGDADSRVPRESAPAAFLSSGPFPAVAETAAPAPAQTASERAFGPVAPATARARPAAPGTGATLLFGASSWYVGHITAQGERVEHGAPPDRATHGAMLDRDGNITTTYRLNDPAKDSALTRLTVHDPQEIELMLDDSGVNQPRGFVERYRYAYAEGRGRLMDYMQSVQPREGLHVIRGDSVAYNVHDFGNLLWGMGMKRLGFSRAATIASSQANAILNAHKQYGQGPRFQLDDPADQLAIRAGHGSALAASTPQSLDRGELHRVESTKAEVFDDGVMLKIDIAASAGAQYRTIDITLPEAGEKVEVTGQSVYGDGLLRVVKYIPWSQLPAEGKLTFEAHLRGHRELSGDVGYRSTPVHGVIELPQQPDAAAATRR
jgi:hypothetical protein